MDEQIERLTHRGLWYIKRKNLDLLVAVSSNTCLFGQLSRQDVLTPILWADRDIFGIFSTAAIWRIFQRRYAQLHSVE
jgi:hypothetical protein